MHTVVMCIFILAHNRFDFPRAGATLCRNEKHRPRSQTPHTNKICNIEQR